MRIKWDYNLVVKFVSEIGLKLLDDKYINTTKKMSFVDEYGYLYSTNINTLQNDSFPDKFNKSNPYTIQNINLWCRLNNKPFKLISEEYKGSHKKLKWRCLKEECNEIFEANWANIQTGYGCAVCVGRQVSLSNCLAINNPKLAEQWHPTLNGDLTPYNVTINSNKKVWWQCEEGHEWRSTITNRSYGNNCPYCIGNRKFGRKASKEYNLLIDNPELCKEWDYEKNNKRPEKYTPNSGKKVWWICKECGYEWFMSIDSRNSKRKTGCPKCNKSKGEKKIADYLNLNNIYYIPQFKLSDCKNERILPFDFAIFKNNTLFMLIEYDGILHFVDKFNNPEEFNNVKLRDFIKTEYCKNHNIKLLRIPYWDFDNIESILQEHLNLSLKNVI